MGIYRQKYPVTGCQNSHFFVTIAGVVTTTLTQAQKFTMGNVVEVDAPVWQLCDSRHDNPIANMGGLLPKCLTNPMDMYGMKKDILNKIKPHYGFGDTLFCVVTGMSSALVALINACSALDVELKLLHFDIVHECYQIQDVENFYLSEKKELYGKNNIHCAEDLLTDAITYSISNSRSH